MPGVPSDSLFKAINVVHRFVVRTSRGKIGGSGLGMPVLELTTVGRTSGQKRTVMLTAPVQEGDSLVVVASKGGDDKHPAWFLNVQANPDVEVAVKGGPTTAMRARVVGSDERVALWQRVVADHSNYAGYQKKTTREIPLVVLEPR